METRMNYDSLQLAVVNTIIGLGLASLMANAAAWIITIPTWILAGIGTVLFGAVSTLVNLWIKDNKDRIFKAIGIDLAARRQRKLAKKKNPLGLDE